MMNGIIGIKSDQTQTFDNKGNRIPVTMVKTGPCPIVHIKTKDIDGYDAVQLGIGNRKNPNKPMEGTIKKSGLEKTPLFLREVLGATDKKVGDSISVGDIFKEGDVIKVIGTGKGKGFAGVVKRHHFKGGPKTHGQSDRLRAPGAIGSTTTPGRVYRGKRMAGRMGGEQVTMKNLKVVKIDTENNILIIKGLIPGPRNGIVVIEKM